MKTERCGRNLLWSSFKVVSAGVKRNRIQPSETSVYIPANVYTTHLLHTSQCYHFIAFPDTKFLRQSTCFKTTHSMHTHKTSSTKVKFCFCTSIIGLEARTFFSTCVSVDEPPTVAKYRIAYFADTVLPAPDSPDTMIDWSLSSLKRTTRQKIKSLRSHYFNTIVRTNYGIQSFLHFFRPQST